MTFCIHQYGLYTSTYRAAVHLGTWTPMRYQEFGPVFTDFAACGNYIQKVKA